MSAPEKNKRPYGAIFFLFFLGLAFFLVGCATTYLLVIRPFTLLDRARAWVETPARILDLELERHDDSDGTTYSIRMCYQYEVNGQPHTSDRFTAFGVSDNISDYHHRNYNRYKPLFDANEPVTCWVNPANPADAIIDRTPRFEMLLSAHLFTFTFPAAGLWLMLAPFLSFLKPAADPDALRIPLRLTPLRTFALPAALTLTYTAFLFSKLIHFTPWPWQVYPILLPAAILTVVFLYQRAYRKAFSGARLDLPRLPALGDTLSAALHIPKPVEGEITVTLRCQRRCHTSDSDGDTSTSTETLWENDATVLAVTDGMTTTVPIRFAIPPGQPAATDPGRNPSITWQLRAKVRRRTLTFDIPVRATQRQAIGKMEGT